MAFEVRFKNESLQEISRESARDKAYPQGIARKFRKLLNFIRSATGEPDLYAYRGYHFERLKGERQHQYSMRLNDQWRVILEMEGDHPKRIVWIVAIEDYH